MRLNPEVCLTQVNWVYNMEYIRNTLDFYVPEPSVISLGKFDGLHLGHKYLIRELEKGKQEGYKSVVFTFDIPPRSLSENDCRVLSTNAEKEHIFEEAGMDYVIECPFTDELKQMEPYAFLKMLTERIRIRKIVAGTDFRFGSNRSGSPADLKMYEKEFGYQAVIVDKIQYMGEDISSTRIRKLVCEGRMEEANTLLGYPYFLNARVLHGNEIGRKLGFPTVNLLPPEHKILPPNGVYVSSVTLDGELYYGVSNIGCKPSIEGTYPVGVETHIFDFDSQIYDREIKVSFLSYLRPERKFNSLEELRRQIEADRETARCYCRGQSKEKK
ncbi:MAG: bifunctional riboflavin kinase/FAD synthetase [Clostridiales bacterium]|nr:bifunctional riboflavin kinase/FAD synthetase [Clostridiales bacterium]